ncbi:MAG TPA: DUF1702 family protein [Leptolyngbyaceae cyanobacterium]
MTQDILSDNRRTENRRVRGVSLLPAEAAQRLNNIHSSYTQGYQIATTTNELEAILPQLSTVPADLLGFALEGVGTGLGQRDLVTPTEYSRVEAFVKSSQDAYENYVYVGVGLMLGRQKLSIEPYLESLSLTKLWPLIDGYGFQYGFSHWQDYLQGQPMPATLSGYACQVFDQGMGRSIWFIDGTDVNCIPKTIAAFPQERQINLWAGVGYACVYAGGVERQTLEALKIAAGPYEHILTQAAASVAKSRQVIGNADFYTELGCEVMCGMGAKAAAETVDKMLDKLCTTIHTPAEEGWQPYRIHLLHHKRMALLSGK